MNMLEERLKKFWSNDRKRSEDTFDEMEEELIPNVRTEIFKYRSLNIRSLIRLYHWISTHKCLFFLLTFICIPMILYMILIFLSNTRAFIPKEFKENQDHSGRHRLLLVVAHPDDECLFFSPTLRVLHRQYHVQLSLLVFSRGNHVGLGDTRAKELVGSCLVLGIPKERCISLDLVKIQDNPKTWWFEQELIPIINEYVNKWEINVLVTFDNRGISGHINHRAVGHAVRELIETKNNTKIELSYELNSVSLLRKYSSILDFYLTFISYIPRLLRLLFSHLIPFQLISPPDRSHILLINTFNDYYVSRAAFASHQTQFSWDRHIYLITSRYMFINELKSIDKQ